MTFFVISSLAAEDPLHFVTCTRSLKQFRSLRALAVFYLRKEITKGRPIKTPNIIAQVLIEAAFLNGIDA